MIRILYVCLMFAAFFEMHDTARAEADGPDTWAVNGVAADDVLNIRENPDAESKKLGEANFNAVGLKNLGCNESTYPEWGSENIAAREAIMNKRWCKVEFQGTTGWVRGKFLKGE